MLLVACVMLIWKTRHEGGGAGGERYAWVCVLLAEVNLRVMGFWRRSCRMHLLRRGGGAPPGDLCSGVALVNHVACPMRMGWERRILWERQAVVEERKCIVFRGSLTRKVTGGNVRRRMISSWSQVCCEEREWRVELGLQVVRKPGKEDGGEEGGSTGARGRR